MYSQCVSMTMSNKSKSLIYHVLLYCKWVDNIVYGLNYNIMTYNPSKSANIVSKQ